MKYLFLFLVMNLLIHCDKKAKTDIDSDLGFSTEIKELITLKENYALKDGLDALLNNAIYNTLSEIEPGLKSKDKNEIEITTKIFQQIESHVSVSLIDGDLALVNVLSIQEDLIPQKDMKVFYYNSKNWEPVRIEEKKMKYELYDINGDGNKDILGVGGCCGNLALVMSIVHNNSPPDISNTGFFHAVIEQDGKYEVFKKGACEKFYALVHDHDHQVRKEIKTKVTYDCNTNKFNEEGL
jgi:hypothetical protein